ncbi:MAG: HNH endonuclease family protein [Nocardioides sp.]|nr:HNH endonuclease family protein [Nocardioides sp.]
MLRRLVVVPALALLPFTAMVASSPSATATAGAASSSTSEQQVASAARAGKGGVVKTRLRAAIRHRPVAKERRAGYDRDRFRHWVDANHNCRDSRDEVLAQESLVRVRGCDVRRGKWRSYYDGAVTRNSSAFDVDHLVPLAEAWDSGARGWNANTRRRYANDLGDRRTLVAVSASANRSKSDRDPAEWMPRLGACRYVSEWVAVKIRWRLSVDRAEKRSLTRLGNRCHNRVIKVRKAVIRKGAKPKKPSKPKGNGGGKSSYPPVNKYDCPKRAPIKGNQSGIYHVPGGSYYARTTPERCFTTERAARRAGYRASKL